MSGLGVAFNGRPSPCRGTRPLLPLARSTAFRCVTVSALAFGCSPPTETPDPLTDRGASDTVQIGQLAHLPSARLSPGSVRWKLTIVDLASWHHHPNTETLILAGRDSEGHPVINVVDVSGPGVDPQVLPIPGPLPPHWVHYLGGEVIAFHIAGSRHVDVVGPNSRSYSPLLLEDLGAHGRFGMPAAPLWIDHGPVVTYVGFPEDLSGEEGLRWVHGQVIRADLGASVQDTVAVLQLTQVLWSRSGHLPVVFAPQGHLYRSGPLLVAARGDRPSVTTLSMTTSGQMRPQRTYTWTGSVTGSERPERGALDEWLAWRRGLHAHLGVPLPDFVRLGEDYPIHSDLVASPGGEIWVLLGPWPQTAPPNVGPRLRTWLQIRPDGSAGLVRVDADAVVVAVGTDGIVTVRPPGAGSTVMAAELVTLERTDERLMQ